MADDRMNLYRLAEEALARYNAARAVRPTRTGAGSNVLARQGALVGAPTEALDASIAGYGANVAPTQQATDADEARWKAWWGVSPGISYERLRGLGASAQDAYALARKLKELRERGSGGGGGGGARPAQPAQPPPGNYSPGIPRPFTTPASQSDKRLPDPFPSRNTGTPPPRRSGGSRAPTYR